MTAAEGPGASSLDRASPDTASLARAARDTAAQVAASKGTVTADNAMSPAELAAFLAEPREARLGTVRKDGDVHLTPIWYLAEPDGRLLFFLESRRLHLANLRRRPRATLLVDEDERPRGGAGARAASFRGAVELVDDPAVVDENRARLVRRYRGPDAPLPQDPAYRYSMCVLTPDHVTTWDFSKG